MGTKAQQISEEWYRVLFEQAADGIFVISLQGRCLEVNPQGCFMLGYSREELLSLSWRELIPADDLANNPLPLDELRAGKVVVNERWLRCKDGRRLPVEISGRMLSNDNILGSMHDISERKRAEETLRQNEQKLRNFVQQSSEGFTLIDEHGAIIEWNRAQEQMSGLRHDQVVGRKSWDVQYELLSPERQTPDHYERLKQVTLEALRTGQSYIFEQPIEVQRLEPNGERQFLLQTVFPIKTEQGYLIGGVTRDITKRRRAEEALRESEERYRTLAESAEDFIFIINPDDSLQYVNPAGAQFLGRSPQEFIGRRRAEFFPPSTADRQQRHIQKVFETGEPSYTESSIPTPRGEVWLNTLLAPVRDKEGEVSAVLGIARDITGRRQMEQSLRESEEKFRCLVEQSVDGINLIDEQGRVVAWNQGQEQMTGLKRTEVLGRPIWEVQSRLALDARKMERAREQIKALVEDFLRTGAAPWLNQLVEQEFQAPDGSRRFMQAITFPIHTAKGVIAASITRDITQHKRAEEALRQSEEKYHRLFAEMSNGCALHEIMYDSDGNAVDYITLEINHAYELFLNTRREDVIGKKASEILPSEELKHWLEIFGSVAMTGKSVHYEMYSPFNQKYFEGSAYCPEKNKFAVTFSDITERKRAEKARVKLEEQLRQSQKMESIGRLAGGVAHDFNNILVVILGYSDLLLNRLEADAPFYEDIAQIKRAGERAAGLVRQLLAFSRQQMLQPVVLNLNEIVADSEKMLRRLIGEDINLVIQLDPAPRLVKVDAGQIEQIILNLAVNARDAMPQGGQLTLETANVVFDETQIPFDLALQPGAYSLLMVSDTGEGMDMEIKSHLFEPFFTTKGEGKGTGLGLAIVYGIVKQSGGDIRVESEPGQGTTFKIYLPIYETAPADVAAAQTQLVNGRGSETILLVEDEEMVRDLTRLVLQENSYTVLEARQGSEALALAEQHQGSIDLLVTDVVMPQMSGREMAEQLKVLHPHMKILFMSGYTDDTMVRHGLPTTEVEFLPKPFSPSILISKVREMLDKP